MMKNTHLFSIGHGSRKAEDFLELLQKYGIRFLADVRSKPYSRFHPQFNKNKLDEFLASHDIKYVFMGEELGGRPSDLSCYDGEGKVDYELVKQKDFFRKGIDRLETASKKKVPLAIMCSERDPCMCHRSKLIGKVLWDEGINVMHIDEDGNLKDQDQLDLPDSPGLDL
jgi:uncharacterized protein (DUF488 family)